jgi:hypothetical protein
MGENVSYLFQPKGLNGEGQPIRKLYLEQERLVIKADDFELVEVPFEIIGTQVSSKSSGFTGMAVEFVRHINGCFHVTIQPKGICRKTQMPIEKHDFDLRDCTGPKIVELSEAALKQSREDTPSPDGENFHRDVERGIPTDSVRN